MEIRNRIIGSGEEPLDGILFNPRNWRVHPLNQQNALKGVLEEVGWVQEVIINKRTGHLVDGHLRCQLAAREGAKTIPVKYVDLSEEEEALVLATLDPIAAMAATDKGKLDSLVQNINVENEEVNKLLRELLNGIPDDIYTREITAPIYQPKGIKPEIQNLYDDAKTNELIEEINRSNLCNDEKEFLIVAARRHTILNYKRIADYYAHSTPEVQRLMENSALVIIDFNKAIELGFVKLANDIASQYSVDYDEE